LEFLRAIVPEFPADGQILYSVLTLLIAEILGELEALESEATETNRLLMGVLGKYR
jgi:hypothetical protein